MENNFKDILSGNIKGLSSSYGGSHMSMSNGPWYKDEHQEARSLLTKLSQRGWRGSLTPNGKSQKRAELSFGFRSSGYHNGMLLEVKDKFILMTCHKRKLELDINAAAAAKNDLPLGVMFMSRDDSNYPYHWAVPMAEDEEFMRYCQRLSGREIIELERFGKDIIESLIPNSVRYINESG